MRRFNTLAKDLLKSLQQYFKRFGAWWLEACSLSDRHWRMTGIGILILMGLFLVGLWIDFTGVFHPGIYVLALFNFIGFPLLVGLGIRLGLKIVKLVPSRYNWIYFGAVFFIFFIFGLPEKAKIVIALLLLLTGSFLGAAFYNLTGGRWAGLSKVKRGLTLLFFAIGTIIFISGWFYLLYPGKSPDELKAWSMDTENLPTLLGTEDPSIPGPFKVDSLTYGWGKDLRREEYGKSVGMITSTVDGSRFLDGWEKISGKLRSFYWKMQPDSLALNGRVWYPVGQGSFPLVLMVHGNHLDRDFSDPGYAYLGRHFASHGIIAVSVDQNFLNGAWSDFDDGLKTENDCRGWLLLKHLEQWRIWNLSDSSFFHHRVDTDRVVLIGHSRGGEAVSIASFFNRLPFYPDNAEERFEFDFGIRGVAAIAPVDGQYHPGGIPTPVEDINYFTIQGSMDGDMRTYDGLRQMLRVTFKDSAYHFAAGLYLHGANHGQFNRNWGIFDIGYPNYLLLNRKAIIPAEMQEKVALIYLTAFVKESFDPGSGYLNLFKDYRCGRNWLPDLIMLNQFRESTSVILCGYEEDLDLTTGTHMVKKLEARELALWKEGRIPKKWGNYSNNGVFLGWNNEKDSIPGSYHIVLDSASSGSFTGAQYITFLASDANQDPGKREQTGQAPIKDANESERKDANESAKDIKEDKPPDFKVVLTDTNGKRYSIRMSAYQNLQPPIKPQVFKSKLFWKDPESEIIPQYVALPVNAFKSQDQKSIESGQIRSICFEFDAEGKGSVILDQIGLSINNHLQNE